MTLGFGFKSYVNYQMRQRKQRDISKENLFFVKLLQEALPAEEPLLPIEDTSCASLNLSSSAAELLASSSNADSFNSTKDQHQLIPISSAAMQLASQQLPPHSINSNHHNSNTHHKHAQSSQSSKAGATIPTSTPPNGNATNYTHSNGSVPAPPPNNRPNRRSWDKASGSDSSTRSYLQTSSQSQTSTQNTKASSNHSSRETNGKLINHNQSSSDMPSSRDKDAQNGSVKQTDNDSFSQQSGSATAKRQSESHDRDLCETGGGPSKDSKQSSTSQTCKNTTHPNGGVIMASETTLPTTEPAADNVVAVEKAPKG